MAELVLGALLAIVGALVVVLVPDADAAGLMLCAIGAGMASSRLTHGPTLAGSRPGYTPAQGRDDFSGEVRS